MQPCPGQPGNTQCLWRDACRSVSSGELILVFSSSLVFNHAFAPAVAPRSLSER